MNFIANMICKKLRFFAFCISFLTFPVAARSLKVNVVPFGASTPVVPVEIFWEESWLRTLPPGTYQHGIARMACLLADIAYADLKTGCLAGAYDALGVAPEDMEFHYDVDYDDPEWGNDQCAFSFAKKDDLLFIIIRGTPIGANEWISNLNVNDEGRSEPVLHEGFRKAALQLRRALDEYVDSHKIDVRQAHVLITGHSRGAAVANLLAAQFAEEDFFAPGNVYAYTFAAPNVTTSENAHTPLYNFIWNIVNAEDIVPTVPLNRGGWHFQKYGNSKVLANAWNTDELLFDETCLPAVNDIFSSIMERDYYPFMTGPFIPIQVTTILTIVNKDVETYYKGVRGLHGKGAGLFQKLFPESSDEGEDGEKKHPLFEKIISFINAKGDGVYDYMVFAFNDMHTCETYLSFLLALPEETAFSSLGCSQLVVGGTGEGAVLDKDGSLLLRFADGRIDFSSLAASTSPLFARDMGMKKIVIGLPANADFDFYLTNESLLPSALTVMVEHYDAEGILVGTEEAHTIYSRKGEFYSWCVGSMTVLEDLDSPSRLTGSERRILLSQADILKALPLYFDLELHLDTDFNLSYGIHGGTNIFYGTFLFSSGLSKLGKFLTFTPGFGTQQELASPFLLDFEALAKCTWVLANTEKEHSLSLVPSLRLSLSLKPIRRFRIFAAGAFDFAIRGFNDAAFDDDVREKQLSKYRFFSEDVHLVPELQFGIRF